MSITIRCKCTRYYSIKQDCCPACGADNKKDRQYHIRYDGKAIYAGTSLTIAREIEAKMKAEKRLGNIDAYNVPKNVAFDEFVKKYYEPHYATRKSAERIRYITAYFLEYFGSRKLKSITPAEVELAINLKATNVSPRTRDYYLAVIRRIFNYAFELDLILKSPVKVKQLNVDNTRQRYLKDDEVLNLLHACRKSKSKYIYPMVVIALHTGMRVGEIQKLKRKDLVDGKLFIKSEYTKNSRSKIIPVNESLKVFLCEYLAEHDDFDFDHDYRRPFKTACKEAGIEDFRFHDLRHTFASKLKAQNVNDSVIQKLLGHQTPHMVQRYAHLSPESVLNAIEVVAYA